MREQTDTTVNQVGLKLSSNCDFKILRSFIVKTPLKCHKLSSEPLNSCTALKKLFLS